MKKSAAIGICLLVGLIVLLQWANAGNVLMTHSIRSVHTIKTSAGTIGQLYGYSDSPAILQAKDNGKSNGGKGAKTGKPDLRDVDWYASPSSKNGNGKRNGNGIDDDGQDGEDKKDAENGENGEEAEGFDRLWDVILYG